MIIITKKLSIALVFAVLAPFQISADEVTDVVNDVAAKLVQQLPMDRKIALKSLSPEETGLPEDFLHKLTSDLEAALLIASDFEIDLANRSTMEDVWQEAVEFNNANFDDLYKDANADVMLMMSPRAISTGVEIAISAYALTGGNVGQTLASSGSVLLPIDLQANLGVDVNDLNQQMSQVLAEIEKIGQTGGLISDSNTYAEFYHNARILQQRGEIDLAMRNYEQALAEGYLFVDPLLDLLDLANARYGEAGTKIYFEKKIKDNIPRELGDLGALVLGEDPMVLVQPILDGEITFSPLLTTWVLETYNDWSRFDTLTVGKAKTIAVQLISADYKSGKFQTFYIDKIRGATVGQSATQTYDSMMASGQMIVDWTTTSRTKVLYYSGKAGFYIGNISIQDKVDTSFEIELCYGATPNAEFTCRSLNRDLNTFKNHETGWFSIHFVVLGDGQNWNFGQRCVGSISYTDQNGFKVNSPVLIGVVDYDKPDRYPGNSMNEIIDCAGSYYRQTN